MASHDPIVPLTKYQKRWIEDKSRFKLGVITRQGGKSFASSLEVVDDCIDHKAVWVLLSAGERQSRELIAKVKMHAKAYSQAIRELESDFWADDKTFYKMLEVTFPNGSRVIGLPANPDTAVGWSANILLDEFSKHRDSREIWKAMFPTILRGYKVRVIFTFKGKQNKAYDLFFNAPTSQRYTGREYEHVGERSGWSKHFVNIYQAVDMGLVLRDEDGQIIEPEDLRLALDDDDAWAEDFECIPSDEASAFLPHDLITSVSDPVISKMPEWAERLKMMAEANYQKYLREKTEPQLPWKAMDGVAFPGDVFLGYDVARKRHLSVIWMDEMADGVLRTVAVIELKKSPFFVQKQILHTLLKCADFRRCCIDESGIGAQMAEETSDLFGGHRVEGIPFTSKNKEMLAYGLKNNFQDRGSLIPADRNIRNSLHSVKKYSTTTRNFRFDAEATEKTGHADHFWAKALAIHAAIGKVGSPNIFTLSEMVQTEYAEEAIAV